jgi:ribose transport system substrate-binding protein
MYAAAALCMAGVPASADQAKLTALVESASQLSDLDALKFFQSLPERGLSDAEIIQFFIDLPLSQANKQIYDIYNDKGLGLYAESYPKGELYGGFQWSPGMGKKIVGPYTKNELKLPFSDDYVPVPEGPIGDPNRTYVIGMVSGGLNDAWIANYQDSVKYEVDRHPNMELRVMDYNFDMNVFVTQMDTLTAQKVDAIVTWPMIEASSAPPIERAEKAGIPVLTADRVTAYQDVTSRISGNFPANGAQNGMYLIWQLAQETAGEKIAANVVVLGKPAGSTADTIRTGYFLKVLSYFPGINILQYYHDQDSREQSYVNAQNALATYPEIDAFFSGDANKAAVAVQAINEANRMNSRAGDKKIIVLSIDDSKEVFSLMDKGLIEMNTPYTPLIGDIQVRAAIKVMTGEKVPQDIATPNINMVTKTGDTIFGLRTQKPEDWFEYTFGPPYKTE